MVPLYLLSRSRSPRSPFLKNGNKKTAEIKTPTPSINTNTHLKLTNPLNLLQHLSSAFWFVLCASNVVLGIGCSCSPFPIGNTYNNVGLIPFSYSSSLQLHNKESMTSSSFSYSWRKKRNKNSSFGETKEWQKTNMYVFLLFFFLVRVGMELGS